MKLPIREIHAFALDAAFTGNPAAVCVLDSWLDDALLSRIARANQLSETAFVVPSTGSAEGTDSDYHIRWFTPEVEVELCGHATLATAHVLFESQPTRDTLRFASRSGVLGVRRDGDMLELDFPRIEAVQTLPRVDLDFRSGGRLRLSFLRIRSPVRCRVVWLRTGMPDWVRARTRRAVMFASSCRASAVSCGLESSGRAFRSPDVAVTTWLA